MTKRNLSAALLGIVAAFWLMQALFFYAHEFSFVVAFHNDPFFIVRLAFWGAVLLVFAGLLHVLAGHKVTIVFGRGELLCFWAGGILILVLAFYLKAEEPADYKVLPYVVIPKLFLLALGSFWGWVLINWRILTLRIWTPLQGQQETDREGWRVGLSLQSYIRHLEWALCGPCRHGICVRAAPIVASGK